MPYKRHLRKQHRQGYYWLLKTRLSSYWLGIFRVFRVFLTNLSISEAYFCLKTTQEIRRGMQDHLYLAIFSNLCYFACLRRKSKRVSVYIVKELSALGYYYNTDKQ